MTNVKCGSRRKFDLPSAAIKARAGVPQLEQGKATLRNDKVMRVLEELSLMPLIVPREVLGMLR